MLVLCYLITFYLWLNPFISQWILETIFDCDERGNDLMKQTNILLLIKVFNLYRHRLTPVRPFIQEDFKLPTVMLSLEKEERTKRKKIKKKSKSRTILQAPTNSGPDKSSWNSTVSCCYCSNWIEWNGCASV